MRAALLMLLAAGCGDATSNNTAAATCSMAACGGDLTGLWSATSYCGDLAQGGRCPGAVASGSLDFAADHTYKATLELHCPDGSTDILHDGMGTWSANGSQLTLTPSGSGSFTLPYCVAGSTVVVGQAGSSLYALWARPTR